jgi:hypothetical protein
MLGAAVKVVVPGDRTLFFAGAPGPARRRSAGIVVLKRERTGFDADPIDRLPASLGGSHVRYLRRHS